MTRKTDMLWGETGFNDNSPAGQIDQQLDTAYDVVKTVRDNLELLKFLYDLIRGEGVVNANANVSVIENDLDGFLLTAKLNSTLIKSTNEEPVTYILGKALGEFSGITTRVVGATILVTQMTDSYVYFTGIPGITIKSPGELRTYRKNSTVGFIALDETTWLMIGDMYMGEEIA